MDKDTFCRLFTRLWLAMNNTAEPKGKAEVYYQDLKGFSLEVVKTVMYDASSAFERFPTLDQLKRECGMKSRPGKQGRIETTHERTNMICSRCRAATVDRIITDGIPTGGYYYVCSSPVCGYGEVRVDHLDKPTLMIN